MKISVCMATYNGEHYLRDQLGSILGQLNPQDEVIISDDGSTDGTMDLIRSFEDHRITVYHSNGKNLIANFENALKQATGDVIFLSDQDDIWMDHKVENTLAHLKKNLLVFSNAAMFHGENKDDFELFFKNKGTKTGILRNLYKVHFLGATLAFQKKVLERALPFPKNLAMHDIWLGIIAESMGSTFYIDEPLIYYRRHENAASSTGEKSRNSLGRKLRIRIDLIINLLKRTSFNWIAIK